MSAGKGLLAVVANACGAFVAFAWHQSKKVQSTDTAFSTFRGLVQRRINATQVRVPSIVCWPLALLLASFDRFAPKSGRPNCIRQTGEFDPFRTSAVLLREVGHGR